MSGRGFGGDVGVEEDEEAPALELTLTHAFGFIIVASSVLLILFYIDLYLIVTILFCFSAASCTATVLLRPLFSCLCGAHRLRREIGDVPYIGSVSALDLLSSCSGIFIAALWFFNRNTASWAFLLQDTFGICLCILFLSVIRFSNMRVGNNLSSIRLPFFCLMLVLGS